MRRRCVRWIAADTKTLGDGTQPSGVEWCSAMWKP